MYAVIDRFEEETVVLLVGEQEQKLLIPVSILPENVKEGTWLRISFTVDNEKTQSQQSKISTLLEKLKNKSKS